MTKSVKSNKPTVQATKAQLEMPRINHKVEQIVRAVLIGFAPRLNADGTTGSNAGILNVSCNTVPLICQYLPTDHVVIGAADERGYRFAPWSNSALIVLGLHPTAFLHHMTTFKRDGVPVVKETDNKLLIIEFGALVQCARNAVFQWERNELVEGKRMRRKPILESYIFAGKPEKFA